jgi:hypothetical protein
MRQKFGSLVPRCKSDAYSVYGRNLYEMIRQYSDKKLRVVINQMRRIEQSRRINSQGIPIWLKTQRNRKLFRSRHAE